MQNSLALTCSNCGGVTTIENTRELNAQDLVCKFCGSALKLPDQFVPPPGQDSLREGLLRAMDIVETLREVQTGHSAQHGPVVIVPPQAFHTEVEFRRVQAMPAKKDGCMIGGVSIFTCLIVLIFTTSMVAIPLAIMGQGFKSVNKLFKDVSNQVSNALGTNTVEVRRTLKGFSSSAAYLTYSPDGRLIAGAGIDHIMIWDVQSGTRTANIQQTIGMRMLTFTHNSKQLISNDGSDVVFYAVNDGHIVNKFECRCNSIALSPDGELIVADTYTEGLALRSSANGTVIRTLDAVTFHISHLLFSPDGHFVVAGGSGSALAAWNVSTGHKFFDGNSNATSTDLIAFDPTQNTLVVARDNNLEFYEMNDDVFRFVRSQTIKDSFFDIQGIAFSPDGKEIAMGNFFDDVWVWNIADKNVTTKLKSTSGISAVAYSPDGNFVIGAGTWGDIYEWQLHDQPSSEVQPPTAAPMVAPATLARTSTPGSPVNPLLGVTCSIRPTGPTANVRSGPGTAFNVSGKLANEASVNGRKIDTSGYTWWQLADGSGWVREDVVEEIGGCNQLPEVQ